MTTFGKVLAFLNLVVGVSLLAWGASVYANRADWVDRKTGTDSVEGDVTRLKKEIDRLQKSVVDADAAYGQRSVALATAESNRTYRKRKLDARIAEARQGTFKVQKTFPNNPAFVNVDDNTGAPIFGPDGKTPLRGVDALVKDFNEQVRQGELHRRGDQPVAQDQWANWQALLGQERFPTLGIDDLRTLHGVLSDQVASVEVAANKQQDVLTNLRNEAAHLTDLRVDWTTRLQTLERRQQQLENRLRELGAGGR
ncbi:MAG TPA: hypothetical protein VM533_12065 [Fimbriiglobus sp.]|jgi:hypothetical protein|nr:hypothetical protein [Fimbriiglobus sp.]